MKNGIVWDGLKGEDMTEVYAMVVPTNYKSPVAPPKPKKVKTMTNRKHGVVKFYNISRSFGFISVKGAKDVFFHLSNAEGLGMQFYMSGDRVTFEIDTDRRGRTCAKDVRLV